LQFWGKQQVYKAVAKYSGQLLGYLLGEELEGTLEGAIVPKGIYVKNVNNGRQIFIDLEGEHFDCLPHIDFQPDDIGGTQYMKIFLDGLMEGLEESLGE